MADLLSRGKQTASALLRAQYGTEGGKIQLDALLNKLLSPEENFSDSTKEWCMWLIAGGERPEVFLDKLRVYDSSQTCGLVWHKNFVAYRCRDCGTSPCMSICADCFHGGNHQGHDYNMFRSQAGGACDCGDENVMKKEGFCANHGKMKSLATPPCDYLYMAKAVFPHLFDRLYKEVVKILNSEESLIALLNDDIDQLVMFLQELCKGDVLRRIICDVIVQDLLHVTHSSDNGQCTDSTCSSSNHLLAIKCCKDYCLEKEHLSYLDLLLDVVIKLDFPEKLVTFLLELLPDQRYKVSFTQKFCQKYQGIGKSLTTCTTAEEVEQLSNSIVHISVQLFSNQVLVAKMVQEQNLLHIMLKVLHEMVRSTLTPMKVNDQSLKHLVINCEKAVIKYNCYWPVISDLSNVLTHGSIAYIFMRNDELIEKWMKFLGCLTGMNSNKRVITNHVEYEPMTYNTAYSIEIEASASPMWSLIAASSILNDKRCLMNIISHITTALVKWQNDVAVKPSRSEVSFHLPLFRYFSAFVRQAMSQFNLTFEDLRLDLSLLTRILEWPAGIQVAVSEIHAGLWVRNGHQIQVQSAWYQQCRFCNSMVDLDIFLLQVCAAQLDPDYFLGFLLDRFRVRDWFEFHNDTGLSSPGIDDEVKETMVERLLTLIITLLTCRLHFGMKEEDSLRLEMVTTLCFADRTHSQLMNLVPERSSQSVNTQLFEKVLKDISDYKHPGCDSSGMQQGMYSLKEHIWDSDFDPVHALLRSYNRRHFQSAMDRYAAHLRNLDSTRIGSLWPPFQPLTPVPKSFQGLFRLLHCKKLHQLLYFILYKATSNVKPLSESLIYLSVHLTTLAINSCSASFERLPRPYQPSLLDVSDPGCIIASKCLQFLMNHGIYYRQLHKDDDFGNVNQILLSQLLSDPEMILDSNIVSVDDVSSILGHTLHSCMDPPLFASILPYMSFEVLTSALGNSSSQSEKESHFLFIQFLLESLPVHRYKLIGMLITYLVRLVETEGVALKSISFIYGDSQPLELTMLYMYLINCHEKLFRVYQTPNGLPRDISGIEFPSNNLVENIRHEPRIFLPQSSTENIALRHGDIYGDDGQETSSSTSTLVSSKPSIESFVKDFIEITHVSKETAISLLDQSQQNLEVAVNIYLESSKCWDETMSHHPSNMAMDVDSFETDLNVERPSCSTDTSSCSDMSSVSRGCSVEPVCLNDSMLSLLVKLKTVLFTVTSPLSPRSPGVITINDGIRKVDKLLELISKTSSSNVAAIDKLDQTNSLSPTNDIDDPLAKQELKRKRALERQQKVMAEFASKQQNFLENLVKGEREDIDIGVHCKKKYVELFDCAICGRQGVPSSEEEPVGYVTFLQSGTVLKHRDLANSPCKMSILNEHSSHGSRCGSVYSARKKFLFTFFDKITATEACELGIDGGVRIQSCGHCLHLKCQQSYVQSLKGQDRAHHQSHVYDPKKEEFTCPVCRRLGNAILPVLPCDVMPPSCSKYKEAPHKESIIELEMTLTRCSNNNWTKLTKSALLPSVLSMSVSSLVESIRRLDLSKERGQATSSDQYQKFCVVVETARSNLEAEHIAIHAGKAPLCAERHFYGILLRTLQYQSQSFSRPMLHVFSILTGKSFQSSKCEIDVSRNEVPLLLRDCVSLLLQLMLSWPAPLNLRSFRCLVQIVFNVVCVQALIKTCCQFSPDERLAWQFPAIKENRQSRLTTEILLGYVCLQLKDTKLCQGTEQCPGISQSVWSPHTIETTLQKLCLPFLRLVSSLSYLCYNTNCPVIQDKESEFCLLTSTLGLHDQSRLSGNTPVSISSCFKWSHDCPLTLIKKWCKQLCSFSHPHEIFPKDLLPGMDEWQAPKLLQLPKHYDSLFQNYHNKKCQNCRTIPVEPTLCLLCGTFVCLRGNCCERQDTNECVRHAKECGYGTAIFLIIMSSSIFIIRGEKASVWGSVYLDEFGEEDIDLRRGKPLFLSTDRYNRLQEQWINHNFDTNCKTWGEHNDDL